MLGFHYDIELYLNMGYYTIEVLPHSMDTTTIATKFLKVRYNRLPMGIYKSRDIFQDKIDNFLGDI